MPEVEHKPSKWYIVNDSPLVVSAGCTCGNDNCSFTAVAYDATRSSVDLKDDIYKYETVKI